MRGAKLEVRVGSNIVAGRLLSVETSQRAAGGVATLVDVITLVSDAGDVRSVALEPGRRRARRRGGAQSGGQPLSRARRVGSRRGCEAIGDLDKRDGRSDLFVSYVSEVPVWKATYRLVLSDNASARKPMLQGWAIVDNTVGQDWENVELSLVAGAPQSFVQQISRPYYVQRPVVPLPERFLLSPQTAFVRDGDRQRTDWLGGPPKSKNRVACRFPRRQQRSLRRRLRTCRPLSAPEEVAVAAEVAAQAADSAAPSPIAWTRRKPRCKRASTRPNSATSSNTSCRAPSRFAEPVGTRADLERRCRG